MQSLQLDPVSSVVVYILCTTIYFLFPNIGLMPVVFFNIMDRVNNTEKPMRPQGTFTLALRRKQQQKQLPL